MTLGVVTSYEAAAIGRASCDIEMINYFRPANSRAEGNINGSSQVQDTIGLIT